MRESGAGAQQSSSSQSSRRLRRTPLPEVGARTELLRRPQRPRFPSGSLSVVHAPWVLTRVTACSRHASITQSSFTAPKIPQTLPVHLPVCVLSCEFVVLCDSGHRKLTITFSLAWTSVWNRCSMEKGWVGPKHPAALAWRCHRGLLFPAPPQAPRVLSFRSLPSAFLWILRAVTVLREAACLQGQSRCLLLGTEEPAPAPPERGSEELQGGERPLISVLKTLRKKWSLFPGWSAQQHTKLTLHGDL